MERVASFTDAWIETEKGQRKAINRLVASFTDAWIETCVIRQIIPVHVVASFTDAWIETRWDSVELMDVKSHLLQMRGLKLDEEITKEINT